MSSKRGLLLLALPAACGLLLIVVLLAHREEPPLERKPARRAAEPAPTAAAPRSSPERRPAARAPEIRPPADPVGPAQRTVHENSFRSTYRSYRSAVANGNALLQEALKPVLQRDAVLALRLVDEDLSTAHDESQRAIARKTADTLRR